MESYIPIYRAERIDGKGYVKGFLIKKTYDNNKVRYFLLEDKHKEIAMTYEIKPETHAVRLGKRNLFMSLDIKTGKGGDKIADNKVLIWNDEMMSCSILEIMNNGTSEYEISLDNSDFDRMTVIGVQQ